MAALLNAKSKLDPREALKHSFHMPDITLTMTLQVASNILKQHG